MKQFLIIIFTFFGLTLFSQSEEHVEKYENKKTELKKKRFLNNANNLIGKWKCYHKELENGTTKSVNSFSGKEFEYSCKGLIIELKFDFTGLESINGLNFKYQRNDSILKLGNRNYIIEKLTKNKLVIRDYDSEGINISNFRKKFEKVN